MKLKPVVPFEPVTTDEIPHGTQWIAQVKWDGVRVLTYYDGHECKLFNRKLNERTFHYPELTNVSEYCSASSVVLDGEIIALRNGKPSFYEVMKRDGLTKLSRVDVLKKKTPITYMIFDLLFLNGKWVTAYPLEERQKMLQSIIQPIEDVLLVENVDDPEALYEVIKEQEMEGIIIKDLSSTYVINGKDHRWQKKKCYRDLIAVVGGVTLKDKIVNALLLGLFDQEGRFWYIGHVGTGKLTQKDWLDITGGIQCLIQSSRPFVNEPSRVKDTLWLTPTLTVKVNFAEWTDAHTLRQPSIQAFVNVSPYDCRFDW